MLQQILKYQELDAKLRQIESEINSTEEYKKLRQAKVFMKNAEESLGKLNARASEINILIENARERYAEAQGLLAEYVSAVDKSQDLQELNYLQKKTQQLQKNLETINKDILGFVSEIENLLKTFDSLKNSVPAAKKQFDEYKPKFDALRKEREGEITSTKKELEALAGNLPGGFLDAYSKLRAEGVNPPVVSIVGGNRCGGGNMEMPMGTVSSLGSGGFIRCENCRRIVFKE